MHEWDEVAEGIFNKLGEPIKSYADAERIVAQVLREESYQVRANVTESLWHLSLRAFQPNRKHGVAWVST